MQPRDIRDIGRDIRDIGRDIRDIGRDIRDTSAEFQGLTRDTSAEFQGLQPHMACGAGAAGMAWVPGTTQMQPRDIRDIGRDIRDIGRDIRDIGRDMRDIGRDIRDIVITPPPSPPRLLHPTPTHPTARRWDLGGVEEEVRDSI